MSPTLESLQTRVLKLEQELAALRQLVTGQSVEETPTARGRRLLEQSWRDKHQQKPAISRIFAQMGIDQPPVPAEQLRHMMAANGAGPEDNLFSRGIQEMREE